ncbi:MAG: DNA polymerase III subunit gamma/tau [Bacillota bacterium]
MSYLALYREWRPRRFAEVVGQDHVVRTLVNAVKGGRVSHAYLFCGPRGTGKTSIAKILSRAVNCSRPVDGEPCGRCEMCLDIEAGTSMDVTEIDAASNRGIDEIRDLREKVKFAPAGGGHRVFIIDEVHMLTNEAFNALLKTLEEPPGHVLFVLATTEPHRVPVTILSRCQRFDFRRIGDDLIAGRLREVAEGAGIEIEAGALELIVRASEGGLRDALSILDQAASYGGSRVRADDIHGILGTVREDLLKHVAAGLMEGRAGEVLELVGDIAGQGKDLRVFLRELNGYMRRMLLERLGSGENGEGTDRLSRAIRSLLGTEQEMRWSTQPRILLEVALVSAARHMAGGGAGDAGGGARQGDLPARVMDIERKVADLDRRLSAAPEVQPAEEPNRRVLGEPVPVPAYGGVERPEATAAVVENKMMAADRQEYVAPVKAPAEEKPEKQARVRKMETKNEVSAPGREREINRPAGEVFKKIDSRWNDLLELAKKIYPNIATHLAQGKAWPLDVDGDMLTIAFPGSEPYAHLAVRILESEANRNELSDLIKSVFKVSLRVRLVESGEEPPARQQLQKSVAGPEDFEALFGEAGEDMDDDAGEFDFDE